MTARRTGWYRYGMKKTKKEKTFTSSITFVSVHKLTKIFFFKKYTGIQCSGSFEFLGEGTRSSDPFSKIMDFGPGIRLSIPLRIPIRLRI
jgi:hypothetical protein